MSDLAFYNPILALLHNTKLNRWHPIVFLEAPLPGPDPTVVRHKSSGHDPNGFATKDEAFTDMQKWKAKMPSIKISDVVFEWDGEGIPARVHFFSEAQDEAKLPVTKH